MTLYSLNGHTLIGVIVPEGAFNIQLTHSLRKADVVDIMNSTLVYTFAKDHQGFEHMDGIYLGSEGFRLLGTGTADKITEAEAKMIVESGRWYDGPKEDHGLGWVTYYRKYPDSLKDSCLLSAIESLYSFLGSHNHTPEQTVLLYKKNN